MLTQTVRGAATICPRPL